MAKYITRTIKNTACNTLCMNTETAKPETISFKISGDNYDEKTAMKEIASICAENIVPCKVLSMEVSEILMGMPVETFMEYAEILPPRTNTEN